MPAARKPARKGRKVRRLPGVSDIASGEYTSSRLKNVRDTRNLKELLPEDAGEYADDLLDILSRMAVGYWPTIGCEKGWYPILVQLNKELKEITDNYEVLTVKTVHGELTFNIKVPDFEHNLLPSMTSSITVARGRCRCTCEKCGEKGDTITTQMGPQVLCTEHAKGHNKRRNVNGSKQ